MSDLIKLGKYEIIKELGRGGFGIVYHARDLVLGRDVALKVLHSQHTVDVGFIGRFEQEARLSAQLEHPNLVPVYDFSELDGRYFIAMGLMSGGSLKDQLRQYGPIDTFRTKKVLNQVLEGMRYIHDKDVVHRDLKPSNILFDPHGTARISDLGFAKASKSDVSMSLSTSGGLVGTPAYMAPEVWRGKPATAQSDIYSLGCIVYEMLTGRILFDGETPAEAMTKHIIDGAQFEAVLASPWQALLARMLMKEPSERYSSAGAVLEDLKWGLFDASPERESEIVLGGLEDEEASAEGLNDGEVHGDLAEEVPKRVPEDVPKKEINAIAKRNKHNFLRGLEEIEWNFFDKSDRDQAKEKPKRMPKVTYIEAVRRLVEQRRFSEYGSYENKKRAGKNSPQIQYNTWQQNPSIKNRGNKAILYFLLVVFFVAILALLLL